MYLAAQPSLAYFLPVLCCCLCSEAHAVRVEAECANLRESLARESEVAAARIADLTQVRAAEREHAYGLKF